MSSDKSKFYSGTSGLVVPVPRSAYPPEYAGSSRLAYYASLLNSLEVNSIFYRLPRSITISKWADMVPQGFRFTFKLSKTVTHCKNLEYNVHDITEFFSVINIVEEKRGVVLVQLPPKIKLQQIRQVEKLFEDIKAADEDQRWRIAVEFRDSSWYHAEVIEMFQAMNVSIVIHDLAASATPLSIATADFRYLRFHGPEAAYRGSYSAEILKEYSEIVQTWLKEGLTVYCYFNNTMGAAIENLQTLNELVSK